MILPATPSFQDAQEPMGSPGASSVGVLFHAVATCDPANPWLLTFVSTNVQDLLGFSAEGLLRDPQQWFERILPNDRQRVIEMVARAWSGAVEHPSPLTLTFRYRSPDGMERRLTNTVWIGGDQPGGPRMAYGHIRPTAPERFTAPPQPASEDEILATLSDTIALVDLAADRSIYVNHKNDNLPFLDSDTEASFKVRLLAYTHPLDQDRLLAALTAAGEATPPHPPDPDAARPVIRVRARADGWREWQVDWRVFRHDPQGRPEQLLATWHDITRERQREREQQLQHELLGRIADTIPHVLYVADLGVDSPFDGALFCSRSISELLGYPAHIVDTVGWHRFLLGHLHPDDWPVYTDALRRIPGYPFGGSLEFEYRLRAADGEWRWLRERDQVLESDERGRATRIIGLIEDVHSRHQLEEQVRAERDFARLVLNALGQGVLVLDRNGACEYLNPAAGAILGLPVDRDRANADRLAATCEWLTAATDGTWPATVDIEHRKPDGGVVALHVTRSARTVQGELTGHILVVSDITERQQLQASLARANQELSIALERARLLTEQAQTASRAKSDFLATMSHEIRTPLNAVIGLAEMLQDQLLTVAQREDALHTIRTSSEALLDLVNDILDFSKIEAGRLTLDPGPQDLVALVEDTVDMFAARARARQIVLMCDLDPALPSSVFCDGTRLRQVLVNLIGNALKFTPQGRVVIRVDVEQRSSASVHLRFRVEDSGVGIPVEAQRRLFEPFEQAGSDTAGRYGGTGLGLAIVKRIVQRMGGDVSLESQVGQGTAVTLHIPMALGQAPEHAPVALPPDTPRAVLLTANPKSGAILRRLLTANRISFRTAASGRMALQMLRQAREPVALMIDDTEGDGDVDATVRLLLEDPALARTRAFVVTSAPLETKLPQLIWPIRRDALLRQLGAGVRAGGLPIGVPPTQPSAQRPCVLLAEDNPINQQVARLQLQSLGVDADVVDNGAAALAAYRSEPGRYAAILMDCLMPVMDGYQATREVRAEESLEQRIPIIAMTANAQATDRDLCLAVGMDDYVSKPVSRTALATALTRQGVLPSAAQA